MSPGLILERERARIKEIAARHGVGRISVFGSVARGEASEASDLDLLIEVTGPTTPWFPGGLVSELEELLGCRVDVAEAGALDPLMRDAVLREARPL
jgi:predicted nucleotidyltransferase